MSRVESDTAPTLDAARHAEHSLTSDIYQDPLTLALSPKGARESDVD